MFFNKKILAFIELIRPYNITPALLALSIGFFFEGKNNHWSDLIFSVIIVILLHSIATLQNDIEDIQIDIKNKVNRPLENKTITLKDAKLYELILLIVSLIFFVISPLISKIFIVLFLLLAWLYNKKPFQLSHTPIYSILILGLTYSLVPMIFGFVISQKPLDKLFIISLFFWFCIRISISILKDYKDEEGDKTFNKKTFFLIFGTKITSRTSFILASIGYIGIFIVSFYKYHSWLLLLPFLLVCFNFINRIRLLRVSSKKANILFHTIFFAENRFEVLYLICLLFL